MSNWLFTFLVVMITPVATTNIGWRLVRKRYPQDRSEYLLTLLLTRTYLIFTVLNASFVPIIYFFFPETAGLSLEALDNVFDFPGPLRGVLSKEHRRNMLAMSADGGHELHNDRDGKYETSKTPSKNEAVEYKE